MTIFLLVPNLELEPAAARIVAQFNTSTRSGERA